MGDGAAGGALAIDVTGVHKRYGRRVHALRGIDLKVGRGEVFGLLGPNGAGKSTLVKILMTVIRPTQHAGHMLGRPIGDKATLARVGYLPEHHRFPPYLTGAQVIDHFAALAGVDRRARKRRVGELLELVGMEGWAKKRVRGYSKGMRQRIGVAQALANDPDLVLLDEPTDGVDPVGRRDIRDVVQRIKARGKSVFINSHLLSELEMVCDRVAILVQGTVASQGTLAELTDDRVRYEVHRHAPDPPARESLAGRRAMAPPAEIDPGRPAAGAAPAAGGPTLHGTLRSGEEVDVAGAGISVRTSEPRVMQPVLDALRAGGFDIAVVRVVRPTLEDLFMEAITDREGRELKPGAQMPAPRGGTR